jgi:hypothetical protein
LPSPAQLCELIDQFLRERILTKPEEDRTKREELMLETGRAFYDVLVRESSAHAQPAQSEPPGYEQQVTKLLKQYNSINADYARRDADAEAIAIFRRPNGERR